MAENSGLRVNYYLVKVDNPQRETQAPYQAECEDIIRALGMNFDEGSAFKALWRTAAARTLGKEKANNSAVYNYEKVVHYGGRLLKYSILENEQELRVSWVQSYDSPVAARTK